jgi:hypothetical protein
MFVLTDIESLNKFLYFLLSKGTDRQTNYETIMRMVSKIPVYKLSPSNLTSSQSSIISLNFKIAWTNYIPY